MKGQYFSFDAIIASVIFVLALVALLSYWHSVRSFLEYQNDPLSKEAIRVSNLLFIPGSPSSDCASMTQFGLANRYDDRRVNASIINCINSTKDGAWLRSSLGTPYNVTIKVTRISDAASWMLGGDVSGTPNNIVKLRRLATVVNSTDGTTYLASFDLTMYR
jgi:hypothetical protein